MKKIADDPFEPMNRGIETMRKQLEDIQERTAGTWNKLEEVFQARVARALRSLGVPTRDDIQRLSEQVDLLTRNLQQLTELAARPKPKKTRAIRSTEPRA